MGGQPVGQPDPRAPLPLGAPVDRRGDRRDPRPGALQRFQLDPGTARLEPHPPRSDHGRSPRAFRSRDRHLGNREPHRGRTQGARDRSGAGGVEGVRRGGARRSVDPSGRGATAERDAGLHRDDQRLVRPDAHRPAVEAGRRGPPGRENHQGPAVRQTEVAGAEGAMTRESAMLEASGRRAGASEPEVVRADPRFRALLSDADWAALPPPVRRRFSKRLADGNTAIYVGEIRETWMSRTGWLLAQAVRVIGGPLPTATDAGVPSVVTVTEDMATGGQIWTRLYARRHGFPQVIHSSKRFAGPTGLEEYVGFGVGMTLKLSVEAHALCFRSVGYFIQLGQRRF